MELKEILFREEIDKTFAVLRQLYVDLEKDNYIDQVSNMLHEGYKMAAIFDDNGDCVGVIGIRIIKRISLQKTIEIEDFMIDRQKRGIGIGRMLLKWVDFQAVNYGCQNIIGNLQTIRKESQKIFLREKFLIDGLSMKKQLK